MFVLLEHDTPPNTDAATPRAVHWDLLVDAPGSEPLPTWRLAQNPLNLTDDVPAERIPDHRRRYLSFEGALSGGRGSVRQIDRGPAEIERLDGARLVVDLRGEHLRGRFEIAANDAGQLVLRRLRDDVATR